MISLAFFFTYIYWGTLKQMTFDNVCISLFTSLFTKKATSRWWKSEREVSKKYSLPFPVVCFSALGTIQKPQPHNWHWYMHWYMWSCQKQKKKFYSSCSCSTLYKAKLITFKKEKKGEEELSSQLLEGNTSHSTNLRCGMVKLDNLMIKMCERVEEHITGVISTGSSCFL